MRHKDQPERDSVPPAHSTHMRLCIEKSSPVGVHANSQKGVRVFSPNDYTGIYLFHSRI